MDPVSRRFMWDVIKTIKQGRSVVLTTHSMEECEALCSRVGIMVAGGLKCLGSVQHLKGKFGKGYKLEVKLGDKFEQNQEQVKKFILDRFEGAALEEEYPLLMKFELPRSGYTLAQIFRVMEENQKTLGVEDYSIAQTSLEQIFVSIAKSNDHEAETKTPGN
jgi:ABC-type multidrug transport system ATPase subunit